MNTAKTIVTRMPPSPTGHLHIGTVRTALFNYLFAKHHGGKMILRIEDTDRERSRREYETEIIEGLRFLGIKWDNREIYRQSERTNKYRAHLDRLLASGNAYVSKEESKREPGREVEVIRLKNPNTTIVFSDLIRGDISFNTEELGDMVIARALDDPLYHLTVVVDDEEMGVTHVLRGEDHISNTSRQILIQEALGFARPEYAHLPLILALDKSKLSKRHGVVAIADYFADGYLPEAIVNYLALLGWNPGTDEELFMLPELVERFDITQVQKGGAVFDLEKFRWFNKQYLDRLSEDAYQLYVEKYLPDALAALPQYEKHRLEKLLPVIRERVSTGREIREAAKAGEYDFAFAAPVVELPLLKWKNDNAHTDTLPRLLHLLELLKDADFSSPETIKAAVWDYAEEVGRGEVLWPFRVALTGRERSPDPFTCAYIIGHDETLHRLNMVCDKMLE